MIPKDVQTLIKDHIGPMKDGVERASLEHFLKTGTISGGFFIRLEKLINEAVKMEGYVPLTKFQKFIEDATEDYHLWDKEDAHEEYPIERVWKALVTFKETFMTAEELAAKPSKFQQRLNEEITFQGKLRENQLKRYLMLSATEVNKMVHKFHDLINPDKDNPDLHLLHYRYNFVVTNTSLIETADVVFRKMPNSDKTGLKPFWYLDCEMSRLTITQDRNYSYIA